ncbi:unnamed protein product [Mortierella alpina]
MHSLNALLLFSIFLLALTTVQADQREPEKNFVTLAGRPEYAKNDTESFNINLPLPLFDSYVRHNTSSIAQQAPTEKKEELGHVKDKTKTLTPPAQTGDKKDLHGPKKAKPQQGQSETEPPLQQEMQYANHFTSEHDSGVSSAEQEGGEIRFLRKVEATDSDRFCILLPDRGKSANDTETVRSYCTSQSQLEKSMRPMPAGLIHGPDKWEHHKNEFEEVRAMLDLEAWGLDPNDWGMMYFTEFPTGFHAHDKARRPYVAQYLEPNERLVCLRLCRHKKDCDPDREVEGCDEQCKRAFKGCKAGFSDLRGVHSFDTFMQNLEEWKKTH